LQPLSLWLVASKLGIHPLVSASKNLHTPDLTKTEEKETGHPTKQKKKNKRLSVANPDAVA
jgi:hypothetical protein